jgi:Ribbon-helix-helix domain
MRSVIKRSISMDGHKTSITLEDAFWSGLKEIAQAQGASVQQMVKRNRQDTTPGVQPLFRDPPVRARQDPFKSGGHRTESGSP